MPSALTCISRDVFDALSASPPPENRYSCYVNRCAGERSPTRVIALCIYGFLRIVRSASLMSSPSGTRLMRRASDARHPLWRQGRKRISLARTYGATWHPPEGETLQSRTCLLADWLRYRGLHLESPSIRASR